MDKQYLDTLAMLEDWQERPLSKQEREEYLGATIGNIQSTEIRPQFYIVPDLILPPEETPKQPEL